jgi:hypothetical protein
LVPSCRTRARHPAHLPSLRAKSHHLPRFSTLDVLARMQNRDVHRPYYVLRFISIQTASAFIPQLDGPVGGQTNNGVLCGSLEDIFEESGGFVRLGEHIAIDKLCHQARPLGSHTRKS